MAKVEIGICCPWYYELLQVDDSATVSDVIRVLDQKTCGFKANYYLAVGSDIFDIDEQVANAKVCDFKDVRIQKICKAELSELGGLIYQCRPNVWGLKGERKTEREVHSDGV